MTDVAADPTCEFGTTPDVLPRTAYVEILYGCNIKCTYCYIGEDLNFGSRTAPTVDDWRPAFERLRALGTSEVIFLGGEPTIHSDFSSLLGLAVETGFSSRGIVTNGTALSQENIRALENSDFWADVTVRASTEDRWTRITRSAITWRRFEAGIRRLAASKINTALEFDCARANFDDLYDTVRMTIDLGLSPSHVQLHRVLPTGDGRREWRENLLNSSEWSRVFEQAEAIEAEFGCKVLMEDGLPFCVIEPKYWSRLLTCACGTDLITVSPTFDLRRCACDSEVIANLFDTPEAIRSALATARTPVVPGPCKTCPALDACRSGCAASEPGSNGQRPDAYEDLFAPLAQATWEKYGGSVPNGHLLNQKVATHAPRPGL